MIETKEMRGILSYENVLIAHLEATQGNAFPERIECSPATFNRIVDRIFQSWVDVVARRAGLSETEWYQAVLAGDLPLTLLGSDVVRRDMSDTEIRFINTVMPELNRTLNLVESEEVAA